MNESHEPVILNTLRQCGLLKLHTAVA